MLASSSRNESWSTAALCFITALASATDPVQFGIDRLWRRRGGAALRQDITGDLQHLFVGQRLADPVRQHALERRANLDVRHAVGKRTAVQPVVVGQVRTDE